MLAERKPFYNLLTLLLIVAVAAIFRLTNVNWDQGHHLHPDERFLNMTIGELEIPQTFAEYLDPRLSPLNPRNHGKSFFVYGNWPINLSKYVSTAVGAQELTEIAIVGRVLSALTDVSIVILIYLAVWYLEKKTDSTQLSIPTHLKTWSSVIYALSVLPIQQAHFFTSDTFLNLYGFAAAIFTLVYCCANNKRSSLLNYNTAWLIVAGIGFGLGIGSKITALLHLPLIFGLITISELHVLQHKPIARVERAVTNIVLFSLIAYLTLRVVSPYLFASANIFNFQLEPAFLNNLQQLNTLEGDDVWYPPAIQWIGRPATFGVTNLAFFGIGLAAFFFALIGVLRLTKQCIVWLYELIAVRQKKHRPSHYYHQFCLFNCLILFWLIGYLVYFSSQFVVSMRYFLPLYPFLAVLSGLGISTILKSFQKKKLAIVAISLILLIWPCMFISIYLQPHSRVQASHWIYLNIPANSNLVVEHWDDGLPLPLAQYEHRYQTSQLPVFDQDTDEKWQVIDKLLSQGDYYLLSSNRAWGSITRVSEKYPLMSKFYQDLFAGKTDFQLVAKFYSSPSLSYLGLPISFNDSWAEEAFSVYDHPTVYIFARNNNPSQSIF